MRAPKIKINQKRLYNVYNYTQIDMLNFVPQHSRMHCYTDIKMYIALLRELQNHNTLQPAAQIRGAHRPCGVDAL